MVTHDLFASVNQNAHIQTGLKWNRTLLVLIGGKKDLVSELIAGLCGVWCGGDAVVGSAALCRKVVQLPSNLRRR